MAGKARERLTAHHSLHSIACSRPQSERAKVAQRAPTLCDRTDSTVHGILQARECKSLIFFILAGCSGTPWGATMVSLPRVLPHGLAPCPPGSLGEAIGLRHRLCVPSLLSGLLPGSPMRASVALASVMRMVQSQAASARACWPEGKRENALPSEV